MTHVKPSEFTRRSSNKLWVLTHFRQSLIDRVCPGKSTATFVACTDTTNTSVDAFVVNPEVLDLQFQAGAHTRPLFSST